METAKLTLTILIFVLFTPVLSAQTEISVQDTIRTDSIWDVDIVNIADDLVIAAGATLTIAPGTLVEAQGHFKIEVRGTLLAEGLAGDTIVFTSHDTTGFTDLSDTNGAWQGLVFINTADYDSSILDICKIEYVKNLQDDQLNRQGGAITLDRYTKIRISNSRIHSNVGYRAGAFLCLEVLFH